MTMASESIILGGKSDKTPKGYKRISISELRAMYGNHINHNNLHMPMVQYLAMHLDVVRSLTSYKGVHVCKNPMDSWIFQEIIYERKPTVIIEIGNQVGGSTMMLSDYLFGSDIEDAKTVIGVDIDRSKLSEKARNYSGIKWVDGDACESEIFEKIKGMIDPQDRVMVIDDASHEYEPTLKLLRTFGNLVTKGQYYIVEDTLIGAYMPFAKESIKAHKSVEKFMSETKVFKIDKYREKWFITLNPNGYLEKIGDN